MSVKEYLLKGEKEERFLIKDVADHGCSGGTISELIFMKTRLSFTMNTKTKYGARSSTLVIVLGNIRSNGFNI